MSAALVQNQDVGDEHYCSAFWVNMGAGAFLTLLFMIAAPFLAQFYGEPELISLSMCLSAGFLMGSTTIVQRAILKKKLDFRLLAIIELVAVIAAGTIGIGMACFDMGVWALAGQFLTRTGFMAILVWGLNDWRPSFEFDLRAFRELFGFSAYLLGTRSMNYWVRKLDDLLVGKYIGSNALGIYGRAYSLMLFPLQNVSRVLANVMFPSFSSIQEDKERVKRIYKRCSRAIALVTFPMMAGLAVTAAPLVRGLLGAHWSGMIPILRVFAFVGLIQSIATLNGSLFQSQGRTDVQFKLGLFVKVMLIIGIVIGLQWGIVGVAAGYGIACFVTHFVECSAAISLINMRYWEFAANLAPVLAVSASMAAAIWLIGHTLPVIWPPLATLLLKVTIGVSLYAILIHVVRLQAYVDVRNTLAEHIRPKFPKASALLSC